MQISTDLTKDLARAQLWLPWALRVVRVLAILAGAWLLTRLARRLLGRLRIYTIRMMDRRGEASAIELEKRATTIISVLSKLASMVIWIIALVMALTELTFNIQPLLAGLGAAGLAVGLGAQALIKDWLGGMLLLLEDQIRIGDSVVINGIAGSVEEINLRTTVLRGENGAVHIISNGLITTLSNMTREYAYYVFEATLAHRADVDRALSILQETGAELGGDEVFRTMILAPIEVMGVEAAGRARRRDPGAHQDRSRKNGAGRAGAEPARECTAGGGADRVSAGGGHVNRQAAQNRDSKATPRTFRP